MLFLQTFYYSKLCFQDFVETLEQSNVCKNVRKTVIYLVRVALGLVHICTHDSPDQFCYWNVYTADGWITLIEGFREFVPFGVIKNICSSSSCTHFIMVQR